MTQKIKVKLNKNGNPVMLYESDRDVSMDEIQEFCDLNEMEVPVENSSEYWDIVATIREPEWGDFMDNLKYSKVFPKKVVIVGSDGLWDGRHEIVPTVCDTTDLRKFWDKFIPNCDCEVRIGYDTDGLYVQVPHHDGTNCYNIRELTEKGQKYVDKCEDNYERPDKAGQAPYSRKIDWWIF